MAARENETVYNLLRKASETAKAKHFIFPVDYNFNDAGVGMSTIVPALDAWFQAFFEIAEEQHEAIVGDPNARKTVSNIQSNNNIEAYSEMTAS